MLRGGHDAARGTKLLMRLRATMRDGYLRCQESPYINDRRHLVKHDTIDSDGTFGASRLKHHKT